MKSPKPEPKPQPQINPTMITVKSYNKPGANNPSKQIMNQTSGEGFVKKSNTDLIQMNLDVNKIETELLKLNVIEDSVKRMPFKLQPDSVNSSNRFLDETEIKNISDLRLNNFSK